MLPTYQNKETKASVVALRIGKVNGNVIHFNEKEVFPIHHEGIATRYPELKPGQLYLIHPDDSREVVDAEPFLKAHQAFPTT